MTEKDMEDVLEIREALDELAAKIACKKMTESQLTHLKTIGKEFEISLETSDITTIAEKDVEFHDTIYEATENPKLVILLSNLREQMYRYRVEYIKKPENYPKLIKEHNAIVKGLEERDESLLTVAMQKHIKNQALAVKEVIRNQED